MHIIRMRYPWQKRRLGSTDWVRTDVPEPDAAERDETESSDADRQELLTHEYRRRFNRPSGLHASTRVVLRIGKWHGNLVSATVNGHDLGCAGNQVDADITGLLENQNEILVRLSDRRDEAARLAGEVNLLIDDERG